MDDPSRRPSFGHEPSERIKTSTAPSSTAAPNTSSTLKSSGQQGSSSSSAARRQVTSLACNECRRVKCKCDGERPTCGFCERKGLVCDYDPGFRGRTALMAERHKRTRFEEENAQLRQLLRHIAMMPDVSEVQRLLRANEDPLHVMQVIQDASLILPKNNEPVGPSTATTLSQTPDSSTMNSPTESVRSRSRSEQPLPQQGTTVRRGPSGLDNILN